MHFQKLARHDLKLIAAHSGIGIAEVERCVALLTTSGIVSRQRGRYRVSGVASVDPHGGRTALNRLKAHWGTIRTHVSVSEPEETVVLLNLHLVNLFRGQASEAEDSPIS